jgi:hypothetical protein
LSHDLSHNSLSRLNHFKNGTEKTEVNSKVKRLSIAAILSGSGFAATIWWYKSTDKTLINTGETPLAQVGKVSDEVLRRPPTRLLWHSVNTGDPLFNGEAIRTSQAGEARIQFEDGRYIDIEPDSLIVLSKAQGEIALDLMEGGLFVNAKSDGAASANQAGLVLNSAQGKVDLSGASASLSKTDGQKLNLQVVEGSAKIKSKDGQTKELTQGKSGTLGSSGLQFDSTQLKIISPLPNKSVYIDPAKKPEVSFQWTGFPKEWQVSTQVGPNRHQLKDIAEAPIGTEKIISSLPLGKHYWKLVARDPKTNEIKAESPVYRLEIAARNTPALLAPIQGASIEAEKFPAQVEFIWQKPEDGSQLVLEVARDPYLKQKILTQRISEGDKFNLDNLAEGMYFWRMSSFYPDVKEPWSGPVQQFKIIKKADTKPIAVNVTWEKVAPEQFFIDEPHLQLSWTAGQQSDLVEQWKVSWHEEEDANTTPQTIETSERDINTKISKPGRYIASVEAYDKQGRLMGKSENLALSVEPKPVLPAPKMFPSEGPIVSEANGRGELKWENITGAKEYELHVLNKEGKELLNKRISKTSMTLVNLMPGEYTVNLTTIDEHGRPSVAPTQRSLTVPDKSNLRAPAVKKVKVN